MKSILRLIAITVTLGGCVAIAEAQQTKKVPRIGVLWPTAPPDPFFDAFK